MNSFTKGDWAKQDRNNLGLQTQPLTQAKWVGCLPELSRWGGAEPPHPEFHAGPKFFLHLKVVQSPNATSSEPSEGGGVSR
ncbi:MAG: hypothetical protein CL859_01395 [Cyanobium sp. ARS6]|nr:hypothetical protein [Cyanobium sp. ARS6]